MQISKSFFGIFVILHCYASSVPLQRVFINASSFTFTPNNLSNPKIPACFVISRTTSTCTRSACNQSQSRSQDKLKCLCLDKPRKIISSFPSTAQRIKTKIQLKVRAPPPLKANHKHLTTSKSMSTPALQSSLLIAATTCNPIPSILFYVSLLMTKLKLVIKSFSLSPQSITRIVLLSAFFMVTFNSIQDMIQTKKRQSRDATIEWGRYADKPALRGRALFALMGKMIIWTVLARVVNVMPGGDYSLFRKQKIANGIYTSNDDNNDDHDNINLSNDNDLNNENNNKDTSWASKKAIQIRKHSGQKLAEGLLRLGPLYIKIGQIISCRDKLLPEEWKIALERLQDRVPAKSGQEAFDLAYQAYNGNSTRFHSIFSDFDDVPLAAASLGQVHRAKLRSNNATVAIKLQRSRLRDIYDKDLALMSKIAKGVDKFAGKVGQVGGVKQSWENIFNDAETILYREIDYRDEASNAIRFASDFGIGVDGKAVECTAKSLDGKTLPSAASWMRTPYIYNEYSTEKILVMEYVPSIKISDDEKLKAAGVTAKDRENLAECLARSYLRQFCVNRFFSTDPHP